MSSADQEAPSAERPAEAPPEPAPAGAAPPGAAVGAAPVSAAAASASTALATAPATAVPVRVDQLSALTLDAEQRTRLDKAKEFIWSVQESVRAKARGV